MIAAALTWPDTVALLCFFVCVSFICWSFNRDE